MTERDHHRSLWDRTWKDKHGNVVIYQHPNWPLWTWLALTLISLFTKGRVADGISWIADAALAYWAVLEITEGVNYFRRILGVAVLLFVIAGVLKNFGVGM